MKMMKVDFFSFRRSSMHMTRHIFINAWVPPLLKQVDVARALSLASPE